MIALVPSEVNSLAEPGTDLRPHSAFWTAPAPAVEEEDGKNESEWSNAMSLSSVRGVYLLHLHLVLTGSERGRVTFLLQIHLHELING